MYANPHSLHKAENFSQEAFRSRGLFHHIFPFPSSNIPFRASYLWGSWWEKFVPLFRRSPFPGHPVVLKDRFSAWSFHHCSADFMHFWRPNHSLHYPPHEEFKNRHLWRGQEWKPLIWQGGFRGIKHFMSRSLAPTLVMKWPLESYAELGICNVLRKEPHWYPIEAKLFEGSYPSPSMSFARGKAGCNVDD